MLATLYGIELNTINYHIKKIYEDNELEEASTIRNFRIVQKEGNREVSRNVAHYNLQMIIAIGFKVDNERAVQLRLNGFLTLWDHEILKDNGKISAEMAKIHTETEFEKYRIVQDKKYISDFDELLIESNNIKNNETKLNS